MPHTNTLHCRFILFFFNMYVCYVKNCLSFYNMLFIDLVYATSVM